MKKLILKIVFTIILLSITSTALAYEIPSEYTPENTPFYSTEIDDEGISYGEEEDVAGVAIITNIILRTLAGALLYFAAPLAILVIILGAFKLVMGGAETETVEQGKKQLTWAILGLLLIMLSYSLVRILLQTAIMAGNPIPKDEEANLPRYAETEVLPSLPNHLA